MKLDYDGANVARATPAGTGDDNHRLRRAIAMYQLFGGSFGLQVVWRLFGQVGRLGFWIPFLTLVIFAGTASAGILLWRDHHHAETLTAFAQMVQVPIVLSSSVGYYCIAGLRSEEHTSELQSPDHLVCRLLLEKKNSRAQQHEK